jgi:hypothetical protein
VFAGLVVMGLVGGLGLTIGGVATGGWPLVGVGVVFLAVGAQQAHALRATACELSIDAGSELLTWRSTLSRGSVPVAAIAGVRRASRPDIYLFDRNDGGQHVRFWLLDRGQAVQTFFDTLGRRSGLDMSALSRRRKLWWRGLAEPPD